GPALPQGTATKAVRSAVKVRPSRTPTEHPAATTPVTEAAAALPPATVAHATVNVAPALPTIALAPLFSAARIAADEAATIRAGASVGVGAGTEKIVAQSISAASSLLDGGTFAHAVLRDA